MFERRCHPAVTKRTWQQVKMKYKNLFNYRNPLNKRKAKSLAIPLRPALWISVNHELSPNLCFLDMFKMTWIIANRKKAVACKTGGGPTPPPLTWAEDMVLSQNGGRPFAEGNPGGWRAHQPQSQRGHQVTNLLLPVIYGGTSLVEPSAVTTGLYVVVSSSKTTV